MKKRKALNYKSGEKIALSMLTFGIFGIFIIFSEIINLFKKND